MCPEAPDPASLQGWALAPPCVLRPQTLPLCWGGLRCRHVSCGPEPYLPAGVVSGAATCPVAPDPASLLGWAPVPSRVMRPQTLPPCWGGLRCHHVSCGPEPYLPAGVGSGATTCPTAPDPSSLLGWALAPPRVHSRYGPWTSRVKEIVAGPVVHLRLAHSPGAHERGFPRRRHA
jgi:hypothetical protein